MIKNLGRKLIGRLPISLESLEKGLLYDLIFPEEVEAWRKGTGGGTILDIRAAHDAIKFSIAGSFNIPYDQLSLRLDSLEREAPILIVCDNGIKSVAASEVLASKGFHFLYVLKGGINLYKTAQIESPLTSAIAETPTSVTV